MESWMILCWRASNATTHNGHYCTRGTLDFSQGRPMQTVT